MNNDVFQAFEDDAGFDEPWFTVPRAGLVDALAALDDIADPSQQETE
jgi:hypothetical protein